MMESLVAIIFLLLFLAFSLLTIIYLGKLHFFFKYLKEEEPQAWKDLGEPHLFLNNTLPNNMKLFKFFYKKQYNNLRDNQAIEKAVMIRNLLTIGIILFPISVLLLLSILISE